MSRILLVEDNEANRDMLSRRLIRRGYEVILAVDGQEGVDSAARNTPDIILMDMDLPVLSGWDATQQLKSHADLKHIPIIALTAHALSTDRDRSLAVGCDDYETKPIDLPRLIEKIQALLQKRSQS